MTRRIRSAALACVVLALLLGACSDTQPGDLESLGLAIEADVQAGGTFEVTVAKDPTISVTDVSSPAGVRAAVYETDDDETMTLVVDVDPDTPAGSYVLLLRTDGSGEAGELEWPFDVVQPHADVPEQRTLVAEYVRDDFVAALAARDAAALQALWPESSWDSLGQEVIGSFVPATPEAGCQPFAEGRSSCFVFEQSDPFVLGLTMTFTSADGWTIESVSLDSTD